ncbi:MAG: hypothetical protein ACTIDT_01840, partial [Halomonas sp.]
KPQDAENTGVSAADETTPVAAVEPAETLKAEQPSPKVAEHDVASAEATAPAQQETPAAAEPESAPVTEDAPKTADEAKRDDVISLPQQTDEKLESDASSDVDTTLAPSPTELAESGVADDPQQLAPINALADEKPAEISTSVDNVPADKSLAQEDVQPDATNVDVAPHAAKSVDAPVAEEVAEEAPKPRRRRTRAHNDPRELRKQAQEASKE